MATVVIPALLRKLTGGREQVTASGRTLRQLIDDLDRQYPGLRELLTEGDHLKLTLAVSIDGEIATRGMLEAVGEQSQVYFIPAISGG
jgi:molybdopterin synthase sulfur carrier subunit